MKVFCVHDVEWWIGNSAESVLEAVIEEYGYTEDDIAIDDVEEVMDATLDELKFTDADENERPTGVVRSFREQLAIELAEGGDFPRLLASEEW
ncbi:hypothetical protein [Stenotrophomonas nitritireducens]|uniref:hypothetical protein n=1 Tax=Stenotrophomonas nitritireducens TaxID=83617 RepID=UPI000B132E22|nr:hypothetical protein [Stenotrophomonas nitritireducens]